MTSAGQPAVLVLGGAGFLGSHVAERFCRADWTVTVVDGLLERTGGRRENLESILPKIRLIHSEVARLDDLPGIAARSDVIVDCMGWTTHWQALRDPLYDLALNAESHLHLLWRLRERDALKIIYLGSRGQYGNPSAERITEETPMVPEDIQGIHKLAGESYYRVCAKLRGLNVVSLRVANCFGPRQPVRGEDIGLVGGFIRDALSGRPIEVFGDGRKRHLVYVSELAEVVFRLSGKPFAGFSAINFAGRAVSIASLARMIVDLVGRGTCLVKEMPDEVRKIDMGDADFVQEKLCSFLGELPKTDLTSALRTTIAYFKESLNG